LKKFEIIAVSGQQMCPNQMVIWKKLHQQDVQLNADIGKVFQQIYQSQANK
jgi:hypothetical protein